VNDAGKLAALDPVVDGLRGSAKKVSHFADRHQRADVASTNATKGLRDSLADGLAHERGDGGGVEHQKT
jgi:hypothetical protein